MAEFNDERNQNDEKLRVSSENKKRKEMLISDFQILDEETELDLELAKANCPHATREMSGIDSLKIWECLL